VRRTITSPHPIDVRLTLGPLAHGKRAHLIDGDTVWRSTRTPLGAATLRISGAGHRVTAEAWGAGAEWALQHLGELVGLEDVADGFEPQGLVRELHRRMPGLRFGRTGTIFEPTLNAIVGQRVPTRAAKASYVALVRRFGEPAPGPQTLWLQPEPQALAAMGYEEFHPLGIERKRADTIRRAAHRASRLEEVAAMSPADAMVRLTAFPGIGAWTASQVIQVAHGDPDAVVLGDYNLPHLVSWNLAGEARGDDERMLQLLEPYRGHRARVVRLLKAGGESPPRYGPRLEVMPVEQW
jgi:3-methyladenine DNA glycosylase/8-oxoguanine DNA glycosylase